MTIISQLTFLLLLWVSVFFTARNGQVKTNLPKENATIAAGQPKLMKARSSGLGGNVYASLADKKGNLWFASTDRGVYRFDARLPDGQGKSFTNFTIEDGLNSNTILSVLEDKKGNIWFGTEAGVAHYNGKTFTDISIPNTFVTSILEDTSGTLWFATNDGVYCYDGKTFSRFLDIRRVINRNGLKLRVVQYMLEDKQGNIWFTTKDEGVCRYDGKSLINYTPNDETWFRGLLEDKNGSIWVGTRYNGVFRYDGETFNKILLNNRFDSYCVFSIIQDKTGNIWFGTEAGDPAKRETEGGVWRYDARLPDGQGTTFKNFSREDGLSQNGVWCIVEDKSGKFWFGTRNGICQYDGKTFTSFSE